MRETDIRLLMEISPDRELRPGWQRGVEIQRTRTIKAGDLLYCSSYPIWDTATRVFTMKNQVYFLYKVLSNLKSIASPLALIVLGGQFEFSAVRGLRREIIIGTFWRVILAPVLGIGCALLLSKHTGVLQCGSGELPALIALFGSPVAVSSAIMAGEMKNDEQLATQLVVWTSICSIGTIFAQVCILMQAGILVL